MTLEVHMEVEVDERAWIALYSPAGSIVNDVENYLLNQIQQSPAAEEGAITFTGYAVRESS